MKYYLQFLFFFIMNLFLLFKITSCFVDPIDISEYIFLPYIVLSIFLIIFENALMMKISEKIQKKSKLSSKSIRTRKNSFISDYEGKLIYEEESKILHSQLKHKITLHEVDFLLNRTRILLKITKDKSEERITWSIVKRADGKLTHDDAKIIYDFIIQNN
jgi:hypothetical protein